MEQRKVDRHEEMLDAATRKGYSILLGFYETVHSVYRVRCKEHNHEWDTNYRALVEKGSKGPCCYGNRTPRSNEQLQELAKSRHPDAKCLAEGSHRASEIIEWQCEKGHRFEASYSQISQGRGWCPKLCSSTRKKTLEDYQTLAEKKNLVCLEITNTKGNVKGKWKCKKCGYEWLARYSHVDMAKCACNPCSYQYRRFPIAGAQEYAKKMGGECLSDDYVAGEDDVLTWKCDRNPEHIFKMHYRSVRKGCWCNLCPSRSSYVIEKYLKELEIQYERDKPLKDIEQTARNSRGRGLMFKFYLPEYHCAIEYDGKHHEAAVGHFGGERRLLDTFYSDADKNEWCHNTKTSLIRIPGSYLHKGLIETTLTDFLLKVIDGKQLVIDDRNHDKRMRQIDILEEKFAKESNTDVEAREESNEGELANGSEILQDEV